MHSTRRSYEIGHQPKFLVMVDETPECSVAVYFAARRAARTGATLLMLGVIAPPDNFEWLGVGDAMRAEDEAKMQKLMDAAVARARSAASIEVQTLVRIGTKADELFKVIDEDEDIAFLILASNTGKDGPGPLVSMLAKGSASFSIPVTVVPSHLQEGEIDAIAG